MKKLFYFAAAAMMVAACTSEELNVKEAQQAVQDNAAVNFDVYTLRGVTRAGTPGDITDDNIRTGDHQADGFGVFAYHTDGDVYSNTSIPNFMYNQQVTWNGSKWTYEPVKYWPNEFGDAAISDQVDYVTFFAYAPWTKLVVSKGQPDATGVAEADMDNFQNKNIVSVTSNKTAGDPIIKYRVDTDPETSVDLLWGVNADENGWASIQDQEDVQNVAGLPFINLNKPKTPFAEDGGKIKFNLMHALAKVRVTIDYIADDNTPAPTSDGYDPTAAPNKINADQTRIYVRWIKMNGFALEGALNLNNDEPKVPNWKAFDGVRELNFDDITFNDGRKDNKEGIKNGIAKNELNIGLNEEIVENFAELEDGKFSSEKNPGVKPFVKDDYATAQLLFGGDPEANGGYFYVIPRGQGESVNIEIDYDVLTLDSCLSTTLSGTKDFGSQVENQIAKNDIFGDGIDFEAGKQYDIHIHLGMTSVKIEAVVKPWDDSTDPADVDLPDNQPEGDDSGSADGISAAALSNVSLPNGGTINVVAATDTDPLTVNYTIPPVPAPHVEQAITGDFARIFAELNAQGVTEITYNNRTYTWSDTANAFVIGNSTIEALLAGAFVHASSFSVTMTTNKGDIKFVKA